MDLKIKRVYDKPSKEDGYRILVDRLWPRGLSKEKAKVDLWIKEIAPTNELRKWFEHRADRWNEFKIKYFAELDNKKELVEVIVERLKKGKVTLLYSAKNEELNNAVALKEYIEQKFNQ